MRSAFDRLISYTGLILAAVLLIAGGLLTWASTFIGSQVKEQFEMQDITMPTSEAIEGQVAGGRLSEADGKALEPFAGKPMMSGGAAKAYANHYILPHMNAGTAGLAETLDGLGIDAASLDGWKDPLTYEAAGAVANAIKADDSLSDEAKQEGAAAVNTFRSETLFKGSTLRGLLLYGYAFATVGEIAGIAAIAAFVGAAVLAVLGVLGLRHAAQEEGKAISTKPAAKPVTS